MTGCSGGSPTAAHTTANSPAAATPISAADNVRYLMQLSSSTFSFGMGPPNSTIQAIFTEFVNSASAAYLSNYEENEPGCVVQRLTAAELNAEQAVLNEQYPLAELVSAGEALSVTTPAGTWAQLTPIASSSTLGTYFSDWTDVELGILPANSSVHVPGDTFPQLSDIALLTPEPLTNVDFRNDDIALLSQTDVVTPDTTVHWNAPDSANGTRIELKFSNTERTEDGSVIRVSYVRCNIEDTGNYRLPTAIRNSMDESYSSYSVTRIQQRSEQRGNILITVQSESQYL